MVMLRPSMVPSPARVTMWLGSRSLTECECFSECGGKLLPKLRLSHAHDMWRKISCRQQEFLLRAGT